MSIGFLGVLSAPGVTVAPGGSAVSVLFDGELLLQPSKENAAGEPAPSISKEVVVELNAPPEAQGKDIEVGVRGCIIGVGELLIEVNGTPTNFGYPQVAPGEEGGPTSDEVFAVGRGEARAGTNRIRLRVTLVHDPKDDGGSTIFDVDSVDVLLSTVTATASR